MQYLQPAAVWHFRSFVYGIYIWRKRIGATRAAARAQRMATILLRIDDIFVLVGAARISGARV